jgi:circadian clock protein KaiC
VHPDLKDMETALTSDTSHNDLPKALTGISGLDAVTFGGIPAGRPTLICGSAGCGKTLFGMTFLVEGAMQFGEAGVLMSFEETSEDLAANVRSLGYDVDRLVADKQLVIDYVRIERSEIEQSGEYDLEGLFVRLGFAIDQIGAKRVVLDTLEALFAGLSDESTLRAELRRLFQWLKDKGVTAVITAERGEGQLTRHGLEEYVSDCVILLDNRVIDQVTTRRLRIVKYRGSAHGSNEYPFLIDTGGISVLPITTAGLGHSSSNEVVPSGVPGIDAMLGAGGFYKGSSILVSGTSGTGKTIIASQFADAACTRGETCLFFAFEESPDQIMRNVASVGIDLRRHVDAGLLRFVAARPSLYGLEMHLTLMYREVEQFIPDAVVLDPISAFYGPTSEIHAMLLRMVDLLKTKGTTGVFTNLTSLAHASDQTDVGLSSLMDTWIGLHDIEANGERNRGLYLLKSRGMSHSNQIREYLLTDDGVVLIKPYLGASGVLTGTARTMQEAREAADALVRRQDVARREREFRQRRAHAERQFAEAKAALDAEEEEIRILAEEASARETMLDEDRATISAVRGNAQ